MTAAHCITLYVEELNLTFYRPALPEDFEDLDLNFTSFPNAYVPEGTGFILAVSLFTIWQKQRTTAALLCKPPSPNSQAIGGLRGRLLPF